MQISECKAKQKQGKALQPDQEKMLLGESQLQLDFDALKKTYPRVAKKMFETKLESAKPDPPKTHEYFFVLPPSNDVRWHDVHQQRLDSDAGAASKVRAAIVAKCPGLTQDAVEVVDVHVDLFNCAYTLYNEKIYRPKVYVGLSASSPAVHQWRPQNKRFLLRVPVSHSRHVLDALSSRSPVPIVVKNVNPLPTKLVAVPPWLDNRKYDGLMCPLGIDFGNYEQRLRKEVKATDANTQDIALSLCSPYVFAVQVSLACPDQPSSQLDLNALGTAFLDIIKVQQPAFITPVHVGADTNFCSCSPAHGRSTLPTPTPRFSIPLCISCATASRTSVKSTTATNHSASIQRLARVAAARRQQFMF